MTPAHRDYPQSLKTEGDIQRNIIAYLRTCEARGELIWWRNSAAKVIAGRHVKQLPESLGVPDLCCVLAPRGTFLGLEVKSVDGAKHERPEQSAFRARLVGAGGHYAIVTTVQEAEAAIADANAADHRPVAAAISVEDGR